MLLFHLFGVLSVLQTVQRDLNNSCMYMAGGGQIAPSDCLTIEEEGHSFVIKLSSVIIETTGCC